MVELALTVPSVFPTRGATPVSTSTAAIHVAMLAPLVTLSPSRATNLSADPVSSSIVAPSTFTLVLPKAHTSIVPSWSSRMLASPVIRARCAELEPAALDDVRQAVARTVTPHHGPDGLAVPGEIVVVRAER